MSQILRNNQPIIPYQRSPRRDNPLLAIGSQWNIGCACVSSIERPFRLAVADDEDSWGCHFFQINQFKKRACPRRLEVVCRLYNKVPRQLAEQWKIPRYPSIAIAARQGMRSQLKKHWASLVEVVGKNSRRCLIAPRVFRVRRMIFAVSSHGV